MKSNIDKILLEIVSKVSNSNDFALLKKIHFILCQEADSLAGNGNDKLGMKNKKKDNILTPSAFKIHFLKETKKNYPHLHDYLCEALVTDKISLYEMTEANLEIIKEYFVYNMAQNTARTYCAVLKSFLNKYGDKAILPPQFAEILTLESEESTCPSLKPDEIELLENYIPEKNTERDIINAFLITCYCGINGFDKEGLKEIEVKNGFITIKSKQLNKTVFVPANPNLLERIGKTQRFDYSRVTINRIVKSVCKKVGITEEIEVFRRGTLKKKPKCDLVMFSSAKLSFYENNKILLNPEVSTPQTTNTAKQLTLMWKDE